MRHDALGGIFFWVRRLRQTRRDEKLRGRLKGVSDARISAGSGHAGTAEMLEGHTVSRGAGREDSEAVPIKCWKERLAQGRCEESN